jgi:lysophospholipase L1-like esterase
MNNTIRGILAVLIMILTVIGPPPPLGNEMKRHNGHNSTYGENNKYHTMSRHRAFEGLVEINRHHEYNRYSGLYRQRQNPTQDISAKRRPNAHDSYYQIEGLISSIYNERIDKREDNPWDMFAGDGTLRLVAIGDSLTEGVGDPVNGGYVNIIKGDLLKKRLYTIVETTNLGKAGDTTKDLLNRLDRGDIHEEITKAHSIIITIGGNDIMTVLRAHILDLTLRPFHEEAIRYGERLNKILAAIRELNPEGHIYLVGVFNPFHKWFEDLEELNRIVQIWNQTSETATRKYKWVTFVPVHDIFLTMDNDLLYEDNFHPNTNGYKFIANRIFEYMEIEERRRKMERIFMFRRSKHMEGGPGEYSSEKQMENGVLDSAGR